METRGTPFKKTRTNHTSSHVPQGDCEITGRVYASRRGAAHFGVVSLLHLLLVQLDLGVVLLSHLMKGLSQLVLILNLTPRIHLYQASFMLPSGLIDLLGGGGNDIKPRYLTWLHWYKSG